MSVAVTLRGNHNQGGMLFWLTGAVLTAALFFGGGTHLGFLGDVVIQICAIFLLLPALFKWFELRGAITSSLVVPFAVILLYLVIVALQLIPLPPGIWSSIGADLSAIGGAANADATTDWKPLSLTPQASWATALSALPPLAIFLSVSLLDTQSRLRLSYLILVLGALSLAVGFAQVAQGSNSALRFYDVTNTTESVGFFANRNHFAALLYITLILAALWYASISRMAAQSNVITPHRIILFAAALGLTFAIIAGLAMARSRAGVFLSVVALFGIAALLVSANRNTAGLGSKHRSRTSGLITGRTLLATMGVAVLFTAQFGLTRLSTRFGADPLKDLRIPLNSTTLEIAIASLPFGTGLGSFVPVYAAMEKNADIFRGFANRAHNDYAEFILEAGIPAIILILLFLGWFVVRSFNIWRGRGSAHQSKNSTNFDILSRAATLIVGLLLVHSAVDYPLRTSALAAFFAFACALLIAPPKVAKTSRRRTAIAQPSQHRVAQPPQVH